MESLWRNVERKEALGFLTPMPRNNRNRLDVSPYVKSRSKSDSNSPFARKNVAELKNTAWSNGKYWVDQNQDKCSNYSPSVSRPPLQTLNPVTLHTPKTQQKYEFNPKNINWESIDSSDSKENKPPSLKISNSPCLNTPNKKSTLKARSLDLNALVKSPLAVNKKIPNNYNMNSLKDTNIYTRTLHNFEELCPTETQGDNFWGKSDNKPYVEETICIEDMCAAANIWDIPNVDIVDKLNETTDFHGWLDLSFSEQCLEKEYFPPIELPEEDVSIIFFSLDISN